AAFFISTAFFNDICCKQDRMCKNPSKDLLFVSRGTIGIYFVDFVSRGTNNSSGLLIAGLKGCLFHVEHLARFIAPYERESKCFTWNKKTLVSDRLSTEVLNRTLLLFSFKTVED
nr:hypothetical protein [Treponemataceae bacterium]